MSKKFDEKKLLLATGNEGKILELKKLFLPYNIELVSAVDYNLEEPEETGITFEENAILKAKYYSQATDLPALADDSGICIDVLNGAPGIYSARWAGIEKDFFLAMEKVRLMMQQLGHVTSNAHFICSLALHWPDGHIECFTGRLEGNISFPARGENGFGYDAIFVPKGYNQTLAEMSEQQKNSISHRSDAFNQLIINCFS